MDNTTIKLGTIFPWGESGLWMITTSGENDIWGCTSIRSNAFTTFTTEEILKALNL